MQKINWKPKTKKEARLLSRIAKRAAKLAADNEIEYAVKDADMDLTAAHLNGCPLNLEKLLGADDANFGHDVFGIRRYIDRNTGKIPDIFLPRCHA